MKRRSNIDRFDDEEEMSLCEDLRMELRGCLFEVEGVYLW